MNVLKKNSIFVRIVFWGMMLALLVLGVDVGFDLHAHLILKLPFTDSQLMHLLFEVFAVTTLAGGLFVVREHISTLMQRNQNFAVTLHALKDDFHELVERKFGQWELTAAEKDVALLLLRGLATADIAEFRGTSVGTVKLQSHSLMKKSGTSSRSEFMSLFLEEFMDVGLLSAGPQSRADA